MHEEKVNLLPLKEYFTTGEVAELCSVTPDTVLKWIRAGKIPANRTPGGHNRVPRRVLLTLLESSEKESTLRGKRTAFQYCWEFYSRSGTIAEGCKNCIVFRSRSSRCYEMNDLPDGAGYVGLFCDSDCERCDYFKTVHEQPPNVLVVTDQKRLRESLERDSEDMDFDLRIADSEYTCSMLVERFRPDYVVIDFSIGAKRCANIAKLLDEDPRIPFVRIIISGSRDDLPRGCDRLLFAHIDHHFTARMLSDLIGGSQSQLSGAS